MKTYYRTQLFANSNQACDAAVIAASLINGGQFNGDLKMIKELADAKGCPNTTVELIGDNLLHIDVKVNDQYETVCIIEQIELFEVSQSELMDEDRVL